MLEHSTEFYRRLGSSMLAALRHGCSPVQLDDSLLAAASSLSRAVVSAASASHEEDDILSVLNGGHHVAPVGAAPDQRGWPDLPRHFNEHSVSSYWWTNSIDGAAHKSH